MSDLFDRRLRALRRDRAARLGGDRFLLQRAFDECLDRLGAVDRSFKRALLLGCPDPAWRDRLAARCALVDCFDPGPVFAAAVDGLTGEEDRYDFGEERYDLIVAVGTLDTVNELPLALHMLRRALRPDAPLIGALAGGDSLPALRAAAIEADRATGAVAARTHPRIEPASLAGLLSAAGLVMPVVDVDRVTLRYASLDGLVGDLHAMAATNLLADRAPGRGRAWHRRLRETFLAGAEDGRVTERIDLLHFLGWTADRKN